MTTLPPFLSHRRGLAARASRGPAAFTLVELLVVIAILAMLMALLVPTVMRARASATNAKVKAEAEMLHMALMTYKNEYGAFPPADMSNWNDVRRHLLRLFPRIAGKEMTDAETYLTRLSPAQSLVFWLRGFYPNQQFPLTNEGQPGSRKKFFDFDQARLYAASPYAAGTPQQFKSPSDPATPADWKTFPVYFTAHAMAGLPYVYFDSRCYDDQAAGDTVYRATNSNGEVSTAAPYFTSDPPSNPLWSQQHVASDTFQIIASGPDGDFGNGSPVAFPGPWPTAESPTRPAASSIRQHQDNITNFASGALADAAEALKAK